MTTPSATPTKTASTVLVVTASAVTRVFIADGLRQDTYTVHPAGSVADAQLILHDSQPDIAIIDTAVPAADTLPRNLLGPDVPLLLLTDGDDVPRYAGGGRAVTCLPKPFQWVQLRRQMTLLLLDTMTEAAREGLPREQRLRDDQELVLIDRLGDHTVLLAYDDRGAGAHWVGVDSLHADYRRVEHHAGMVA